MIGIIDVGGGMRGSYGAGVFDWCLENNISFDHHVGVSAGSANLCSFLSGQKGRNLFFYADYSFRPEYMGLKHFIRTHDYLDLEYIYGEALTNSKGEYPLDFQAMLQSGKTFEIVATDALTGLPHYFEMREMSQDDYGAIKASSCVPGVNQPYAWKGGLYFDGGLSDPIPYKRCLDAGCEKVVVVLTRPRDYVRDPVKDVRMAKLLFKYPNAAKALEFRSRVYNDQLKDVMELERQGRALIVAPDDISGMKTLTKDREAIVALYHKGFADAEAIRSFLD